MKGTTRQFQSVFYLILGFCILIMILSAVLFDFLEIDIAVEWVMKYFALPILLVTIPICSFIYLKFIIHEEKKKYKSKVWIQLRTIFRIIILTFGMSLVFIGTSLSLIILTNAMLGNNQKININAEVIDYYSTRKRGQTKHYIKIRDSQLDRVELKVKQPYFVGQQFHSTLSIGKWGLLYSLNNQN